MLAAADGAEVEATVRGYSSWLKIPKPSWDWNQYYFRIAQPPPKKVFGPEDFALGQTQIKHATNPRYLRGIVTGISDVGLCYGGGPDGGMSFEDINEGFHGELVFSTDSGATWRPLKP